MEDEAAYRKLYEEAEKAFDWKEVHEIFVSRGYVYGSSVRQVPSIAQLQSTARGLFEELIKDGRVPNGSSSGRIVVSLEPAIVEISFEPVVASAMSRQLDARARAAAGRLMHYRNPKTLPTVSPCGLTFGPSSNPDFPDYSYSADTLTCPTCQAQAIRDAGIG